MARDINSLAGIIKRRSTAPHLTGMKRKTENINIWVEPQLIEGSEHRRAEPRRLAICSNTSIELGKPMRRDEAAKELETDPDTQKVADCIHTITVDWQRSKS